MDTSNISIIQFFNKVDPSLFQNIIIAGLTLFIPIWVGVLGYSFQKRAQGDITANVDLFVLFHEVLKVHQYIIFTFITLFCIAFWDVGLWLQIMSIILVFLYVIWLFVVPLKNIYYWLIENKEGYALVFFQKLNPISQKKLAISSWESLLSADGHNQEKEMMQEFVGHIDQVIGKKDYVLLSKFLDIYIKHNDKRTVWYEVLTLFPTTLRWIALLDGANENNIDEERKECYSKLLNELLPLIITKAIEREFFTSAITHYIANSKEREFMKNGSFNAILDKFCFTFFDNITRWHKFDILDQWYITTDNLNWPYESTKQMLRNFILWLDYSRNSHNVSANNFHKQYKTIVENLFPGTDCWYLSLFFEIIFPGFCRDLANEIQKWISWEVSWPPVYVDTSTYIEWNDKVNIWDLDWDQVEQNLIKKRKERTDYTFDLIQKIISLGTFKWFDVIKQDDKGCNKLNVLVLNRYIQELDSDNIEHLCNQEDFYKHRKDFMKKFLGLLIEKTE